MDNNIIEVPQAEMLQAINRADIDSQIATAHAYPRDINKVLNTIETLATMDQETAEDCFYVLRRKGRDGSDTVIEGLSVRMAEIIANAWGHLRIATHIIGNDGRTITAQAVCHDLETNVAVCKEVKRSILTKNGNTYSQDMQVVTGNAAAAIAYRNAVLTVIPKAFTKRVINNVKQVALGQSIDLETSRQNVLKYFEKLGVTHEQLFLYLGIKGVQEIDKQKIFELRATANAIKEGTTTVQESFIKPAIEAKKQAEAVKKTTNAQDRAAAAIAQATGAQAPEGVDPETGEIKETAADNSKKTSKTTTKK